MKVEWTLKAQEALRQTIKYIETNFGRQSMLNFANIIAKTEKNLSIHPYIGKIEPLLNNRTFTYRSLIVKKLNKIIYTINNNHIIISDFWNLRQNPNTLQNRIN